MARRAPARTLTRSSPPRPACSSTPPATTITCSSTSPAKNAGTSQSAPPADFDGLPRKAGAAFDIGAYEFGALAGDYNRDGAVTAADYVLWRKTLGTNVTRYAGADGDGSGKIDQPDYLRWRADFAAVAAAGTRRLTTPIPEPPPTQTLCLALVHHPTCASVRFQLRRQRQPLLF